MDNSAGKIYSDFELGWLTCAIESEGHITLAWCKRKNILQIMPRIGLTNREKDYMERAVNISKKLGVGVYVHLQKSGLYQICWYGMKRCKKLLEIILPYLCIKKDRARLVLEFINSRLAKPIRNAFYDEKEKELFFQVRQLNGKGRLNREDLEKVFAVRNLRDYTPEAIANRQEIVQTTTPIGG